MNSKALTAEGHLSLGRTLTAGDLATAASTRSFETRLEIPSHVGFITPAVERIIRKLRKSRCIPGKESDVRTALYEAMANAVTHGNREDAKKTVRVRCRYDEAQSVSIVVSDEGQGFDPRAVPDPTQPENLEFEHGRGIFLMKAYMDEVHYEKGGTEVHLVKKCDGPVQTLVKSYAAKLSRFMRDYHQHDRRK
ncbi:MAG TPA: ATP-binding protein [Candidatus Acidoferrales bacterium]